MQVCKDANMKGHKNTVNKKQIHRNDYVQGIGIII